MKRTALVVASVLAFVAGSAAPATHAEGEGVLTGTIAPELRSSAGTVTVARAIDAANISTAAAVRVGRGGAYRLVVPAGVYLVLAEKLSARAKPVVGLSRLVRVKPGGKAALPTIHRRLATAGLRAEAAVAATAASGQTAVAVTSFSTTGPFPFVGRGLADMLATDLSVSRCVTMVEWLRRDDLLKEIKLQQSKYFDPSTRVTPHLIQPQVFIEGSVATTTSSISWNIRMREIKTGRIVGGSSGRSGDMFVAEAQIAKTLLQQLEQFCLPQRFDGSFSGETRVGAMTTFSGSITFVRDRGHDRPGVAAYSVAHVAFDTHFTAGQPCQGSGDDHVERSNVDPTFASLFLQTQQVPKQGHGYTIVAQFQAPASIPIQVTCSGVTSTIPWTPFGALYTGQQFAADESELKGTNDSTATQSTYSWDLKRTG